MKNRFIKWEDYLGVIEAALWKFFFRVFRGSFRARAAWPKLLVYIFLLKFYTLCHHLYVNTFMNETCLYFDSDPIALIFIAHIIFLLIQTNLLHTYNNFVTYKYIHIYSVSVSGFSATAKKRMDGYVLELSISSGCCHHNFSWTVQTNVLWTYGTWYK